MAVIPLMPFVLTCSLAGGFAGLFSTGIGAFCFGPVVLMTDLFSLISSSSLSLPFANITTGHPPEASEVIYYGILAVMLVLMKFASSRRDLNISADDDRSRKKEVRRRLGFRRLAAFAVICLMLAGISQTPEVKGLQIIFLDVDQGECILIRSAGRTVLIDAGSTGVTDVFRWRISSALRYFGISRIDYMIVTHPDIDHVSGLIELLEAQMQADTGSSAASAIQQAVPHAGTGVSGPEIGCILITDCKGNANYEAIMELAKLQHIPALDLHAGMRITFGGVTAVCLHPDTGYVSSDTNDMSAVLRLDYGQFSAVLTGDISWDVEMRLLKSFSDNTQPDSVLPDAAPPDVSPLDVPSSAASLYNAPPLDVSLLDVPHHGSGYSSCEAFIEAVSPDISVISAGVNNSYGHPHPDTVARLEDAGSRIYCTADYGEIDLFISPEGSIRVETMLSGSE